MCVWICLSTLWLDFVIVGWFQLNQCLPWLLRQTQRQMYLVLISGVRILFYERTNEDVDIHDHNIAPAYIWNIFYPVSLRRKYYSKWCHPEIESPIIDSV